MRRTTLKFYVENTQGLACQLKSSGSYLTHNNTNYVCEQGDEEVRYKFLNNLYFDFGWLGVYDTLEWSTSPRGHT